VIRYDISQAELEFRVDAERATWRDRAKLRTDAFRRRGSYDNSEKPIWSEIKQVFIDLQRGKCAFCERPLESKKEYDVEHFRPKSSVKPWNVPAELTAAGIQINQTTANEPGYYLLSYNLLNYTLACAKCNSELKSDYFPIRGTRQLSSEDPITLQAAEEAWLIFPVGKIDDPEKLITFHGLSPQAVAPAGSFAHQRALLTIAFFHLDDRNKRRELFRGRADVIVKLGLAFRERDRAGAPKARVKRCQAIIDYHMSDAAPYTNCGRAFAKLWHASPAQADKLWNKAVDFLATISSPRRRRSR
jgi:hypothetical protein